MLVEVEHATAQFITLLLNRLYLALYRFINQLKLDALGHILH